MEKENYAFISYSSKNQQMADSVRFFLLEKGISCWMAPYDIPAGSKYASVINDALENCSCLVLLLTNASQESEFVDKEVERAITYKKPIIPVQLEDLQLNSSFKFYIGNRHIIAVPELKNDSPEFKRVIDGIYGFVGVNDVTPAHEIDKHGKDDLACYLEPEVKKLKEEIEKQFRFPYEWADDDCTDLARYLCEHKIYELTDEIRDRILYLQIVCQDFEFENSYLGMLVADLSITELEKRYNTYMKYITKYQCRIATMTLSVERIKEYHDYFKELGLTEEQIDTVLGQLIDMGDYIKYIDKMKKATAALEKFQLTPEQRNLFICENANLLYNDFLRKIEQVIDEIIEEHGVEAGFELLSSSPELLRRY